MLKCFDGGQKSGGAPNRFRRRIRIDIVNIVEVYNRQLGHNQLNLLTNETKRHKLLYKKIVIEKYAIACDSDSHPKQFSKNKSATEVNAITRIHYEQMIQQRFGREVTLNNGTRYNHFVFI